MPIPFPSTKSGIEIKFLKHLFSEEEAEIALCLSALPEPVEKIHKRIRKDRYTISELDFILFRLLKKGAIRGKRIRNGSGRKFKYSKLPVVVGMFEAQVDKVTKEMAQDFFEYEHESLSEELLGNKTNQMRTIPLNIKIDPEFLVSNYDDITSIVKNSPGPFAVMNCVCRQARDAMGQSCRNSDIRETCLLIEGGVEFARNLDVGREITRDEMLKILTRAKKAGFVLQPANTQNPHFICCCCGCCCGVLTAAKARARPAEFLHSNFYAQVDANSCDGCEKCVERCQMDAIARVNGHMEVAVDRCIGCGVCVPTCRTKSMSLFKKEKETVPPPNSNEMYKRILVERFGVLGAAKFAAKAALGMKI
jgi:NAD-dependent dihydropyrimidine dehydrogenase PreA subunit